MAKRIEYLDAPPKAADLVVIGGGVVGAATAFHAARAGLGPVVIERRPAPCTLTTPASTGAFRLQFDNREELEVVRESVDLFLDFTAVTEQDDYDLDVRQQGYLWVTTDEATAERQKRLVEDQHSWGLADVEVLAADEVRSRFPYVTPDVVQARFRAGDGFLNPKALTMGLLAGAEARVVVECAATGFEIEDDRLRAVDTSRGAIATDRAVVACGPFSRRVLALAGIDLPVHMVARQKIVFPELPLVPSGAPMTIDEDTGSHWRPALAGAFLLFTDPQTPASEPQEDVPVDSDNVFRVLHPEGDVSAARIAPFWREVWERNATAWLVQTGQYTMSADHRPLAGPTGVEGLYVNSGDSGHGVMSSPAVSRLLVDVLTGARAERDNPFRLDRAFKERDHDVL